MKKIVVKCIFIAIFFPPTASFSFQKSRDSRETFEKKNNLSLARVTALCS